MSIMNPPQYYSAHPYQPPPQAFQNFTDVAMEEMALPIPPPPFLSARPLSPRNVNTKQDSHVAPTDEVQQALEGSKRRTLGHCGADEKREKNTRSPLPAGKSATSNLSPYDAQDALPYFSVGQTILTSKVPRVQARCVLLNKNLTNIEADWRSGNIKFSTHLKYKLDLARPRNWQPPATTPGFKAVNVNRKPPDPLQFRKLIACRDSGVPIKLLATGDFPSLPVVDAEIELDDGTTIGISSDKWRNGLV
ncbi:hypothetical protein FRC07_009330, partial [Ceratobasidium sp. 392]